MNVPSAFFAAIALLSPVGSTRAASCDAPRVGSKRPPIVSPPLGARVIGTGRLPFYSAPDSRCPIAGTFVIPDDTLVIYAQTDDGWSSVGYFGSKAEGFVDGWVRTFRLEVTGEMGPRN